jgi:hypothetical protein
LEMLENGEDVLEVAVARRRRLTSWCISVYG